MKYEFDVQSMRYVIAGSVLDRVPICVCSGTEEIM